MSYLDLKVLLYVLDAMNTDRQCWPSTSTLSFVFKRTPRSIQMSIKKLVSLDLIETQQTKRHSTTIKLGSLSRVWIEKYEKDRRSSCAK